MAAQVISEGLEVVIGGSFGLADFREAYAQVPSNPQFLIALLEAEKESGQAAQVAELRTALRTAMAENPVPDGLRRRAEALLAEP